MSHLSIAPHTHIKHQFVILQGGCTAITVAADKGNVRTLKIVLAAAGNKVRYKAQYLSLFSLCVWIYYNQCIHAGTAAKICSV